jgi:hypothetical protein
MRALGEISLPNTIISSWADSVRDSLLLCDKYMTNFFIPLFPVSDFPLRSTVNVTAGLFMDKHGINNIRLKDQDKEIMIL